MQIWLRLAAKRKPVSIGVRTICKKESCKSLGKIKASWKRFEEEKRLIRLSNHRDRRDALERKQVSNQLCGWRLCWTRLGRRVKELFSIHRF